MPCAFAIPSCSPDYMLEACKLACRVPGCPKPPVPPPDLPAPAPADAPAPAPAPAPMFSINSVVDEIVESLP